MARLGRSAADHPAAAAGRRRALAPRRSSRRQSRSGCTARTRGPPVASASAGMPATKARVLPSKPAAAISRGVVAGSSGRRRNSAVANAASATTKIKIPPPGQQQRVRICTIDPNGHAGGAIPHDVVARAPPPAAGAPGRPARRRADVRRSRSRHRRSGVRARRRGSVRRRPRRRPDKTRRPCRQKERRAAPRQR